MIQRIDIKNFGSFSNFVWNAQIKKDGNVVDFKKLNILYGRNYSGKTTLSRIVRSLETGELPSKYSSPEFSIKTDEGIINETGIQSHGLNVRVFNKDFIDGNLSFLKNDSGKIEPFAVLGGDNTRIESEIAEKEQALGSLEKKHGLRYEYSELKRKWLKETEARNRAQTDRSDKLRNKARELKQSPDTYGDVNYDIRKIENDISEISRKNVAPLGQDDKQQLSKLLRQEALPEIKPRSDPSLKIGQIFKKANELLGKEIKPTKPIQDLLDDALLQAWARQGITLHKDKRETCGFCGNPIPDGLWDKLHQHFSKESKDLDESLSALIKTIESEGSRVENLLSLKRSDFYPTLLDEFESIENEITKRVQSYSRALTVIASALKKRQGDPFKIQNLIEPSNVDEELEEAIAKLAPLLQKHSKTTKGLADEQIIARRRLRLSEVSNFVKTIDLSKIDGQIVTLTKEADRIEKELISLEKTVLALEKAIGELKNQLRDERRGAEKVNDYLSHYFGHDSLRLVAIEEDENEEKVIKFEIKRGESKAYNLSDGECSLIAFCYFMAKLNSSESEGEALIIYIDDPISSLDSDHIFFVFSLIQGLIAAPVDDAAGSKVDRYKQLFISTHNLDFLKFLKRLSKPKVGGKEHFLFVRTEDGSLLELMPYYLQHYVTEFHYLFDQICACTDASNVTEGHHCFFSFGNNLRKFLEIYLFFKFPFCENSNGDYNKRVERFFDDDPATEPMVMRLSNELSHGGEIFDRSVRPVEHAEISKMAVYVLNKVKNQDADQYSDLLQATKRTDPIA
jgi:wobble nucleotide-excising tRNase